MSKFEKMIPFILHCEAGLATKHMTKPLEEQFEIAKRTGYGNDPCDSGGATMCGVTIATYESYCRRKGYARPTIERLKAIPFDHWKEILKSMFWDRWRADEINTDMVAVALVDWTWLSGRHGITKPQALLGVTTDGIVGGKTIAAVNGHPDQRQLFNRIQAARNAFHASIARPGTTNAKFLKGWNRRVAMITWEGFKF